MISMVVPAKAMVYLSAPSVFVEQLWEGAFVRGMALKAPAPFKFLTPLPENISRAYSHLRIP